MTLLFVLLLVQCRREQILCFFPKINCNTTDLLWILRSLESLNLNSWSQQVDRWSFWHFHLHDLQGLWKQVSSVVSDKILCTISPEGTHFSRSFVLCVHTQNPAYKCMVLPQILVYKSLICPLETKLHFIPLYTVIERSLLLSLFLCFICFWVNAGYLPPHTEIHLPRRSVRCKGW